MKLVFIGADHEVTGSCHYMEVGDKKFCVDIGMEQGQDLYHEFPFILDIKKMGTAGDSGKSIRN